jgi:acyl-CoA thioesterase
MGSFAQDIVVESMGAGRYVADLGESWNFWPLPQGGIVTALALRAAEAEIDDASHVLRSSTTTFAGQVTSGPMEIEVGILRQGRSATQVTASIRNPGSSAGAFITAVFGTARRGPSFLDLAMPDVPGPDESRSSRDPLPLGIASDPPPPFWMQVEGRVALGHHWWEDYEPIRSDRATWLRFDERPDDGSGRLDPLGLIALADRMPGSVQEKLGTETDRWFAPSADLTFHNFEPLETEWVLCHDRARWAHDGWASAETTLWSEDGRLVAYATQMMLFHYLSKGG